MANVNLKTDFRNGETLFDYQLNNNFKAIEEALKVANAIIWQDNADKVVTFRGNTEELKAREIIDGQILYNTDTGESYIDYEGKRISTGSGNAIHIGENEPTNASTQLWIDRDELAGVGSEVVNSLEGNQERMSPSVAAVNDGLSTLEAKVVETKYLGENPDIDSLHFINGVYGLYNCTQAPATDMGVLEVLVYTRDCVIQRFTTGHGALWQRTFQTGTNWSEWENKW